MPLGGEVGTECLTLYRSEVQVDLSQLAHKFVAFWPRRG